MLSEKEYEQEAIKTLESIGYTHIIGASFQRYTTAHIIETDILRNSLRNINPNIEPHAIREAMDKIEKLDHSDKNSNIIFIKWLHGGVPVEYTNNNGETVGDFVNIIDYNNFENNQFHAVNQLTIRGQGNEERRPDIILYINGIPLVVFELKSPSKNNADFHIEAFNQLNGYKKIIPQLFTYNAILVIDNGHTARIGSSTADFSRFVPWSSKDGMSLSRSSLKTVIHGLCTPAHIIPMLRDFVFYTNTSSRSPQKIVASWHQFFAVGKALERTTLAMKTDKKIGIVWHTQGSGKSYTMVMYSKILARDNKNPTTLILTDRNDLDEQLYSTFTKSKDYLNNSIEQATSVKHLKELLDRVSGGIIFSTLQKFRGDDDSSLIECLSDRNDIIVIADEAHRSHYGVDIRASANKDNKNVDAGYSFAKQVRTALPNASFIGFTGTPIEDKDRSSREIFGENIHVYGLVQSVADGMTTKITYHNRMASIKLNEPILDKIDAIYKEAEADGTSIENIEKSQKEFTKLEILYENPDRINIIGRDIVAHFNSRIDKRLKAMIVVSSRRAASIMYDAIIHEKPEWQDNVHVMMTTTDKDTADLMRFKTSKEQRKELAENFKDENHTFNLAIVVDMWLTGFDVPCLGTMYIDKELEKHNLMQTIARVNRVYPEKEYGLIYDYRGIFIKLQEALKMYSGEDGLYNNGKSKEQILDYNKVIDKLKTAIEQVGDLLYGVININDLLDLDNKNKKNKGSDCFYKALDYLEGLYLQNDENIVYFKKLASNINALYKICYQSIDDKYQILAATIIALNSSLSKATNTGQHSTQELNKRVNSLVANTVLIENVEDVLSIIEQPNGIDIFSQEILQKITSIPHKNISIKAISDILNREINNTKKINLTMAELYSDKLKMVLQRYENKSISSADVLTELLDIAQELSNEDKKASSLGLSKEEYTFYYVIKNKDLQSIIKTDILCNIAHELVTIIRSSKSLDWSRKESVRATMRTTIKKLLKKYGYPPKEVENATDIIIKEAENQDTL